MPSQIAMPPPDLPVAVCLPDPLGAEVRAWVEGELGWQAVPAGGPPRPAMELRSAADARPGCVVVADGEVGAATLRQALDAGAQDAVGWPHDRERLLEIARQPTAASAAGPPLWRVVGAGGGVGTSTVALAVAGLAAWSRRSVIAVGGDGLLALCGMGPWSGAGLAEVLPLGAVDGAEEVGGLARPLPGVSGLRALGGGTGEAFDTAGWPADLVVVDGGTVAPGGASAVGHSTAGADLVVTAPDSRAARAAGIDAPLLVVGDGPLDERGVAGLAGRRPAGWLPASARVARAGVRGRVPADLPGSWLRVLRDALAGASR